MIKTKVSIDKKFDESGNEIIITTTTKTLFGIEISKRISEETTYYSMGFILTPNLN